MHSFFWWENSNFLEYIVGFLTKFLPVVEDVLGNTKALEVLELELPGLALLPLDLGAGIREVTGLLLFILLCLLN